MDFSYLSASCPAIGENKKKGRINSAAAMLTRVCPLCHTHCLKGDINNQPVFIQIIVEGTEKLGHKKGQKAASF